MKSNIPYAVRETLRKMSGLGLLDGADGFQLMQWGLSLEPVKEGPLPVVYGKMEAYFACGPRVKVELGLSEGQYGEEVAIKGAQITIPFSDRTMADAMVADIAERVEYGRSARLLYGEDLSPELWSGWTGIQSKVDVVGKLRLRLNEVAIWCLMYARRRNG